MAAILPSHFSSGSCTATNLPPCSPTSNSARSGQSSVCLIACMPAHASSVMRRPPLCSRLSGGDAAALM
eukprot:5424112-Alexandrium_andersonii.AAC.1